MTASILPREMDVNFAIRTLCAKDTVFIDRPVPQCHSSAKWPEPRIMRMILQKAKQIHGVPGDRRSFEWISAVSAQSNPHPDRTQHGTSASQIAGTPEPRILHLKDLLSLDARDRLQASTRAHSSLRNFPILPLLGSGAAAALLGRSAATTHWRGCFRG